MPVIAIGKTMNDQQADCNDHFFADEEVLRKEGVTDFSKYAMDKDEELMGDLFLG